MSNRNWSDEDERERRMRAASAAAACPHCSSAVVHDVAANEHWVHDHPAHRHLPGFPDADGVGNAAAWSMGDPGAWGNPGGGGATFRGGGFSSHLGHVGPPVLSRHERLLAEHPAPFAGRGPKGYRRSDERIHEEVCEALTADGVVDACEIAVTVKDGEVTLSGAVGDRRQKRRAEEICDWCAGVKDVHNGLRVAEHEHADSSGSSPRAVVG